MGKFVIKIEGEAGVGMSYDINGIHGDLVNAVVGVMEVSDEVKNTIIHSAIVYEKVQKSKGDVSGDMGTETTSK